MSQLICWLLVGLVHLIPALALFRPALIKRLYRIQPDSPLFLLMHHREALFFAVLVACVWAAFDPNSSTLPGESISHSRRSCARTTSR